MTVRNSQPKDSSGAQKVIPMATSHMEKWRTLAIELRILAGIQDVESRHPEQDDRSEPNGWQKVVRGLKKNLTTQSDPSADGGEHQSGAEPHMDQPSEPFSEAVAPEKQQHRQTQNRWQSVRQKQHTRGDKKDSAEQSKPANL